MFSSIFRSIENTIEYLVFASRWLQAPIYIGLVVGSVFYVFKFIQELVTLAAQVNTITGVNMMLGVLGLIDISMVMNLLIIVIIGGYTIFTSKIDFDGHEDRPLWLDHLDADRLKVKLSTSLASISGVHLLKTFIDIHGDASASEFNSLNYEIAIHLVFIISALALAYAVKLLDKKHKSVPTAPIHLTTKK
jgi:uncharacterized protein (TIGR00645 family)